MNSIDALTNPLLELATHLTVNGSNNTPEAHHGALLREGSQLLLWHRGKHFLFQQGTIFL